MNQDFPELPQDLLPDLLDDPDAARTFRAALYAAAGPASATGELVDRARRGAARRTRRRRRAWAVGGAVAAAVVAGTVFSTSLPRLSTAPSARTTSTPHTEVERQRHAEAAFRAALDAALPTFQTGGDVEVTPSTWTEGSDAQEGWQSTSIDSSVLPGTVTTAGTTLSVAVAYAPSATSVLFPTCTSTDVERGLRIDDCTSQTLQDGTRVESGTLTDTFWVQSQGEGDPHKVSVTAPFATAFSTAGVRVSATAGVADGMDIPLAMGTTLPAGSPLTPASLWALVSDQRLLGLTE